MARFIQSSIGLRLDQRSPNKSFCDPVQFGVSRPGYPMGQQGGGNMSARHDSGQKHALDGYGAVPWISGGPCSGGDGT